jgi:hypothetical protein
MKTLVATALVVLGLLSTVSVSARAAGYDDAPKWVQDAFENNTGA